MAICQSHTQAARSPRRRRTPDAEISMYRRRKNAREIVFVGAVNREKDKSSQRDCD